MRTILFRASALACALMTSTAMTAPAQAQTPPPVRHNVDENGVDLVVGRFEMSQTLLSIGSAWPRGLHYARARNGNEWTDNLTGSVFWVDGELLVSVGNISARFTGSSGSYTSALGDGATLTVSGATYTFTDAQGVVSRISGVEETSRLVDIAYPNGAKIFLHYRAQTYCDEFEQNCVHAVRRQSATNNFGHQIRFAYSQDTLESEEDVEAWQRVTSVRAINTAVEACDPTALSCSLTGSWPTVSFSRSGTQETVTLPDSNAWLFTESEPSGFFPGGYITGIRRPGASSDDVSVTYNGGTVQSLTNAAGTWSYAFSYSAPNNIVTVTGPLSFNREVTSNADGLIVSDEDSLGRTTSYQHDGQERVTRITEPEGNYTAFTYDSRGNLTEERAVAKSGSGASDIVATASYPSSCTNPVTCNQPTSITDPRGNTTDFTYDSTHGGVLTVTAPAPTGGAVRPQTRVAYSSATVGGQTVYRPSSVAACQTTSSCTGGADEAVATISYSGSNDLPSSASRGSGNGALTATTAIAHDDIGNVISIDGPLSGTADTIRLRYNANRQRVGTISPDPDGGGSLKHRAVRTTYEAAGLVSAEETGTVNSQSDGDWASMAVLEGVTVTRDALGRSTVQRLVSGSTTYALTQASYDARGRIQCVAQRMNTSEFGASSLPSDACTLDTEGSYGPDRITRTTYDAAGQLTLVQTGYGVSGVVADEVATTYTNNGQVQYMTDAEANRTTYEYDGHDRLVKTRMPSPGTDNSSSTTDYELLTLDAGGNVTNLRLRDNTNIAFTYDALNRLTTRDPPGSELTVTYSYDLLNRLTGASRTGHSLAFTYDALGRLLSEAGPLLTVSSTYDLAGRRTLLTTNNGYQTGYTHHVTGAIATLLSGAQDVLATFVYDDRGRRSSYAMFNGTGTAYAYDNVSRPTQMALNFAGTGDDLTLDFTPNPAGQIASVARSDDSYAWAGHYAVNRNYTANGLNQYSAIGSITPTYTDSRGNLTSAGSTTYGYDSANMLTSASGGVTLAYDPLGRLYEVAGGGTTRRFVYDGIALIEEFDGSGNVKHVYAHGPGVDEPLIWWDIGAGTFGTYHADERGSVIALASNAGAVTNINAYDEYGIPASGNAGRFQYTGQMWLGELGMYHYRARIYSPTLGRFLQTDPIGYGAGMNLYAYVRNDPVNWIDPSGLDGILVTAPTLPVPTLTGSGVIISGTMGMVAGQQVSENPAIVVTGPRRCGLTCRGNRIRNAALLALHPEIETNVRDVLRYIIGSQLTRAEIDELLGRVMDGITATEGRRLSGVRAPRSGPLNLSRQQFSTLRDVLGRISYDRLGMRSTEIFVGSIRNGRVSVGR